MESSSKKSIFLAGREAVFNGDERCEAFMETHRTTEFYSRVSFFGIELQYENDRLTRAFDLEEGDPQKRLLNETEIGLPYKEYRINQILQLDDSQEGKHQLGGELPDDISFPENDCAVPFQYLGYISNQDDSFAWLPLSIHLMCPIFVNAREVYLDYTNPSCPSLLNRQEVEAADTAFRDLNKQSAIVYESRKFDFSPFDGMEAPVLAGVPAWMQGPAIPMCPKSGKTMRFVCQIQEGVDASYSNVIPEKEFFRQYYEKLNIWGGGALYIFVEPTERTVCYIIQN